MRLLLLLALAQSPTGDATIDSAAVARAAMQRAISALGANDVSTATREVARANSAWPGQPNYAWSRVVVALRAADTTAVRDALTHYAELGVARDVRADARFAAYVSRADFAPVLARLDANRAPHSNGHVIATIDDSTFWPEGVDHDARTDRYYVSSVAHGTIAEVSHGRVTRELWPRDDSRGVKGVRVDAKRNVLWATLSTRPGGSDTTIAALVRVRLTDGAIERRWDLPPVRGGHILGDLALGPNGDVWVTDSQDPALYHLRPGADTLICVTHPLFLSPQGLAPAADGRAVYIADYVHGLLRIDATTYAVRHVADAPGSASIGCDGLAWDRGAVICVQNGVTPLRVMRFVLDASGDRIARAELLDQRAKSPGEPTIGTIANGAFVYIANSPWDAMDDAGRVRYGARVEKPVLVAVPLRK